MKALKHILLVAGVAVAMMGALTGCMNSVNYTYQNADKYTAGDRTISDKIETIDIDYMSGDVTLKCGDSGDVTIKETANVELDDKRKVHTWVDGNTLYVRYCASAKRLNFNKVDKQLDITIPKDVDLDNLKVDISSGEFDGSGFNANSLVVESSSGGIKADCNAKKIDLDVSSGNINLVQHGNSDEISMKASSGEIVANIENASKTDASVSSGKLNITANNINDIKAVSSSGDSKFSFGVAPELAEITASSGDVMVFVPEDSDLKVNAKHSSGDFDYDLPFTKDGDSYVCGKATNIMKITTSSGDASINKLASGE